MDFLPRPRGCSSSLVEIPCLATVPFDGGEFKTFPSRTQWGAPRTAAAWTQIFKHPPADLSAFLQTWLYFGPLEFIFNRRVSLHQFTQKSATSEKLVLDSSLLKGWLNEAPLMENAVERVKLLNYASNIHVGLFKKKIIVTDPTFKLTLQEYALYGCFRDPRDPLIVASIGILLEVGREYLAQFIPNPPIDGLINGDMDGLIGGGILLPSWTNAISARLREQGWCPSEIYMMQRRLNSSGLYFMSHIPRPHQSRRHQVVRIHEDSSCLETTAAFDLCSKTRCRFLQINPKTYHTKHHQDCKQSKCWNMGANPEEVSKILQTGCIPLISPISDRDRSENITLVSSNPDFTTPYIAISHVWSDGMGNIQRSALPRCQLLHLSTLVRNLAEKYFHSETPIHFWIDTIGCPPDEMGHTHAQNLAISLMPQTYQNATAVLVLDAWLQNTEVAHLPHHEILMRIISCNWNSRLWTLQEGALARDLIFQFADTAYNVNQGLALLRDGQDPLLSFTLRALIEERMYEIRAVSQQKGTRQSKLIALTGALSNRSTSVLSDEAICLATLLKFSALEFRLILHASPEDRMRVFWSLFDNVPGRLFFDDFPRLQTAGYHWAPSTFLLGTKDRVPVLAPTTDPADISPQRTAAGLLFRGSGIMLMAGNVPIGESFFVLDENSQKYSLRCDIDDAHCVVTKSAASHYATVELDSSNIDQTDLQEVYLGEMHQINLLESYDTESLAIIFLSKDQRDDSHSSVMLVALQRSHRGVNYGRFICGGSCTLVGGPEFGKLDKINPPLPEHIQIGNAKLVRGEPIVNSSGTLSFVRGFMYGPEQQWCLD